MSATIARTSDNPLLDFSGLPRFPEIEPGHVTPAIDALIADVRETIERVASAADAPSWDNFVQPLSDALDRLDRAWGQVSHLNAVVNTPTLRETYNANLPKITTARSASSKIRCVTFVSPGRSCPTTRKRASRR